MHLADAVPGADRRGRPTRWTTPRCSTTCSSRPSAARRRSPSARRPRSGSPTPASRPASSWTGPKFEEITRHLLDRTHRADPRDARRRPGQGARPVRQDHPRRRRHPDAAGPRPARRRVRHGARELTTRTRPSPRGPRSTASRSRSSSRSSEYPRRAATARRTTTIDPIDLCSPRRRCRRPSTRSSSRPASPSPARSASWSAPGSSTSCPRASASSPATTSGRDVVVYLLPRNGEVPMESTQDFGTDQTDQAGVDIRVMAGERDSPEPLRLPGGRRRHAQPPREPAGPQPDPRHLRHQPRRPPERLGRRPDRRRLDRRRVRDRGRHERRGGRRTLDGAAALDGVVKGGVRMAAVASNRLEAAVQRLVLHDIAWRGYQTFLKCSEIDRSVHLRSRNSRTHDGRSRFTSAYKSLFTPDDRESRGWIGARRITASGRMTLPTRAPRMRPRARRLLTTSPAPAR